MFFRKSRKLDRILANQDLIIGLLQRQGATLSTYRGAFASLQAAVAAQTAVDQSAVTLVQGIAQQLKDNAGDPAAVQALADQLNAAAAPLAAAVTANTPASPATDPDAPTDTGTGDTSGTGTADETGAASGAGDNPVDNTTTG